MISPTAGGAAFSRRAAEPLTSPICGLDLAEDIHRGVRGVRDVDDVVALQADIQRQVAGQQTGDIDPEDAVSANDGAAGQELLGTQQRQAAGLGECLEEIRRRVELPHARILDAPEHYDPIRAVARDADRDGQIEIVGRECLDHPRGGFFARQPADEDGAGKRDRDDAVRTDQMRPGDLGAGRHRHDELVAGTEPIDPLAGLLELL